MGQSDTDKQISSLIKLMDDRDSFVRSRARERLVELGQDALPFLDIAAKDEKPGTRAIARDIIHAVCTRQLEKKFRRLATPGANQMDLEEGMILIMEFGFPHVERRQVCDTLDQMAHELLSRIFPQDPPIEVVQKLTHFLFFEKAFSGNRQNYYHSDNSYLNKVLELKTGLPITLSALCVLLGKRLRRPISGVGLPGHYIAQYSSAEGPIYFDPFHSGRIMTREECKELVSRLGFQFEEHHLLPATNRETLLRMMNNLANSYHENQEKEKSEQLAVFINILS
ncbi:MAG: transglutaminase family protein [Nitrospinota bacterium]|nr:transglutaminase family protein [Nitrospinota bacterium]